MDAAQPSIKVHLGALPGIDRSQLESEFSGFQEMFFSELGIIIPVIQLVDDPSLPENVLQVYINDEPQPPIESIAEGEFWLYLPASQVQGQQYYERTWEARPGIEPNTGSEASIVRGDDADRQLWIDNGNDTRSRQGYLVFSVAAQIRRQPASFLSLELIDYYLTRLKDSYPDLVDIAGRMLDPGELHERLRLQLQAGSSIQNLPALLEEILVEKI
jgi:type III secretory pathway component EscV